jgi:hypothetical protein
MFGWFGKKEVLPTVFPDNETAFSYACTLGYLPLVKARIPALVMEEGRRGSEGEHCYRLHLAGQNSALEIWGCTLADAPAQPAVGDLVAFCIVRIATELPENASLIGYIACGLEPVLIGKKGWRVSISYTPANLKPELHLG